ncbi:hypothetical protein HRI_002208300 [Hibiscus trionum]|uniref:Integrase catalytic domain-containing protein n=1 Tax=Hibiscus trionum TaxID=183268 RepID=A0A9W7I0N2_HIBTR|nr:hypothetical protein HRI_002208300 [Hibiscus trionum]
MAISRPLFGVLDDIRMASTQDPHIQAIRQQIRDTNSECFDYADHEGLILFQGRILVPNEVALRSLLLREFHESKLGGHSGINRTYRRLSANFYWQSMRQDVRHYVRNCQICQRMKSESLRPAGLLQPLPIPVQVFEDLALDFIVGLPKSNGKEAILVVVDRLTKYGHFFALPKKFDSKLVAKILVQGIIKLHGIPKSLVSDRDRIFISAVWTEMAKLQGTELCISFAYHPQTDGQTEALNRCLEMYLRCMAYDDPSKWEQYLPWAEYWYNTAYQNSAGMTPFKALYGRDPPAMVDYLEGSAKNDQVRQELQERNEILRLLKHNLWQAQVRMKNQADKHRRELELAVGSWVYVKLQPYRQLSIRLQKQQKLSPRFFGPYQVEQRVGVVAYRLKLPDNARIHPVFHISQLKPCRGQPTQQITPLPLLQDTLPATIAVDNLEDKVHLDKGGNVMTNTVGSSIEQSLEENSELADQQPEGNAELEQSVEEAQGLRRGRRERRAPKALTDFVRF